MQKLGNSLAVRLTIWFLLLSFLPLGVMAVFVRGNVDDTITDLTIHHQQHHAVVLASSIATIGYSDDSIDDVQAIVADFDDLGRQAFVVNRSGVYVAHSDESKVGDLVLEDHSSELVERFWVDEEGSLVAGESSLLIGYAAIPESGLVVVAVNDESEIAPMMTELERSSTIQLGVSLFIVSIAGGVIIWVVVGNPIRQLTYVAEQVGAGNLWVEVKANEMEDELQVLAITFNQMTEQLRLMVGNLEQHIAGLEEAEMALQQSEERFRSFVENVPVGVFRSTPGLKGEFLMTNPAFVSMFGLESPAVLERTRPADLYTDPDDRKRFSDTLLEQGSVTAMELRFKTGDGAFFWGAVTARTVRDANGEVVYFDGIVNDISGRKQAEEALRKRERQFEDQARQLQHIMDTVPEGVLLLNADGQVLLANPMAQHSLKILADAAVGDTLIQLGDRPLTEIFSDPPEGLWHEVKADAFTFEVVAQPMQNEQEQSDWVLVLNNVTQEREIRRRLQQQERLAAVGQLATGIAHDFRNLLSTIILYAQMAGRAEGMSERGRQQMAIIDERAKHATRLIQQILDFSRRSVLERQPLDLVILLKEEVELLRRTLPEDIEVKFVYGKGDYTVNADPTRMRQMITNLAVNARDAMPEGGRLEIDLNRVEMRPSETLSALPTVEPGEYVRLSVSDTGSGIGAETLPHIFEPFFTTKEPGVGTGLGLAQVHGIVGQHEGHVEVETQEGEGTEFNIYLPCLSLQTEDTEQTELHLELTKGAGELVLVVEDELAVRSAMVETLQWMNYRVLQAADGGEALSLLGEQGEEVRLILSDVVMPEMGGIALFHAVRKRGLNIPIILLTGHPKETELEDLQEQGLAGWLLKPPNMEQLARMVAEAMARE